MFRKISMAAGIISGCLLFSAGANAVQIGSDILVQYTCTNTAGDPQCGGGPLDGLQAQAVFSFFSGEVPGGLNPPANDLYLQLSFRNTSTYQSRLAGIAFDFPTNLASINEFVGDAAYGFIYYTLGVNLPGGINLDACSQVGPSNNCNGGNGQGGLTSPGNSPWATVYFGFDLLSGTAEEFVAGFTPFDTCVRFQSVGPNLNDSGLACGDEVPEFDTPEPGTLALLGLGLIGLASVRRRR